MDLTACSQTCGGGKMKRHRKCDNPSPSNGGKPCQGSSMKAVDCNTQSCTGEDAYSTLLLLTWWVPVKKEKKNNIQCNNPPLISGDVSFQNAVNCNLYLLYFIYCAYCKCHKQKSQILDLPTGSIHNILVYFSAALTQI